MPNSGIAFQIGFLTVRWYGILIVSGMIIAMFLAIWAAKRRGFDVDELLNMVLIAIPAGIIGARLYYVVFMWPSMYAADPVSALYIWKGGLAIHGGLLGGILAVFLYCYFKKQPFWAWADIIIPGVPLAQAIGRWGNYFNQEAYGYVTDLPWAMYIDGAYRHPTFLYESVWDFSCFILLVLLSLHWKKRKDGGLLATYFIYYSIGRFVVECFRTDSLMLGGGKAVSMALIIQEAIQKGDVSLLWAQGIPIALLISLIGVAAGVMVLLFNRKYGRRAKGKTSKALPKTTKTSKAAAKGGNKQSATKTKNKR